MTKIFMLAKSWRVAKSCAVVNNLKKEDWVGITNMEEVVGITITPETEVWVCPGCNGEPLKYAKIIDYIEAQTKNIKVIGDDLKVIGTKEEYLEAKRKERTLEYYWKNLEAAFQENGIPPEVLSLQKLTYMVGAKALITLQENLASTSLEHNLESAFVAKEYAEIRREVDDFFLTCGQNPISNLMAELREGAMKVLIADDNRSLKMVSLVGEKLIAEFNQETGFRVQNFSGGEVKDTLAFRKGVCSHENFIEFIRIVENSFGVTIPEECLKFG